MDQDKVRERAQALVGTPFIRLPGNPPSHRVQLTTSDGTKIRTDAVEMVFNDMLLMDAISGYGQDGPLYKDTLDSPLQAEVLAFAIKAYEGVELPEVFRKPS